MAKEEAPNKLLSAVVEGDLGAVDSLSREGSVNVTNKHGESTLHIAAGYGRLDIVKLLLERGANINQRDKQGDSPLYWSARHGHLEVVQHLVLRGATLNFQDSAGETAVHVSARYGHPHVLSYLCQAGANLNLQDNEGDTPLSCACWHGYWAAVECLVRAKAALTTANADEESPLHVASVRGHYAIVRALCEGGAAIDQVDKDGRSALHLSTKRNHGNIVRYLCEQGAGINIQDSNGDTALHNVCRDGQLDTFHTLHSSHCELNLPNKNGATPLHLAAKYGHTELVRMLCQAGADVNLLTEHGFHADEVAANHNHHDLASLLHQLRTGDVLEQYREELTVGKNSLHRVKLMVLGNSGVGKTELVESLSCGRLKSLLRPLSHHSTSTDSGPLVMSVQNRSFPLAGDFSVWELSGHKDCQRAHECFIGAPTSLYLVMSKLSEPPRVQLAQLRHWLALIKSQLSLECGFAGQTNRKLHVVLVGSFADQGGASSAHTEVMREFREWFSFDTHCLDCRHAQTFRPLRESLAALRLGIIKGQPPIAPLTQALAESISSWRCASFPVLSSADFLRQCRAVNPLVTEQRSKAIACVLHNMGEVVCLSACEVIVMDPHWLGTRVLTPLLLSQQCVTGHLSPARLCSLLRSASPSSSMASLCEHLRLCVAVENRTKFLFPCLIRMEPVYGIWEQDPGLTRYAGVQIQCRSSGDIFSAGLFSRLQGRLKKTFSESELSLWSEGAKLARESVEAHLSIVEPNRTIRVLVRGGVGAGGLCHSLLTQLHSMVVQILHTVNPGTAYSTLVLSSLQLREHSTNPGLYTPLEIHRARQTATPLLHPDIADCTETVSDLVYCGTNSAESAFIQDLPRHTLAELSALLDPPDPMGRDWCTLTLQLGLIDTVSAIHLAGSPTAKLLEVWSQRGSINGLVEALTRLGREDAAQVVINGTSPFSGYYRILPATTSTLHNC